MLPGQIVRVIVGNASLSVINDLLLLSQGFRQIPSSIIDVSFNKC